MMFRREYLAARSKGHTKGTAFLTCVLDRYGIWLGMVLLIGLGILLGWAITG